MKCPLNWARAKLTLEEMSQGERLILVVDDPRAVKDIPRAAEAHGHSLVGVEEFDGGFRIELEC